MIHKQLRQWQRWEAFGRGRAIMSATAWEPFVAKVVWNGVSMPEYLKEYMARNWL
jgi:hypothetical protein